MTGSCAALYEAGPPAVGPTGTTFRAGRRSYASTHAHLGIAGRETLWEPLAASGPEELRGSEWSHGSRHDFVTGFFQSSQQVTVDDSKRMVLN